jgi:NADP-dependent 3-hydroxy acid dehydrogenase YdfG
MAAELEEVDTLLNNAGSAVFADVETITLTRFVRTWRENALCFLLCAREMIRERRQPTLRIGLLR